MAAERDLKLLDDYLANRLNARDRSAFEQKLNADASLQHEYELQRQFINGIKNARIAQLKAMLGNIAVPSAHTGGNATAGKIALWALATAIAGTAIYFSLRLGTGKEIITKEIPAEKPIEKQIEKPTEEEQQQPLVTVPEKPSDKAPVVSRQPASSEQKPAKIPEAAKEKADTKVQTDVKRIPDVFDPTKETEEDQAAPPPHNGIVIPETNNSPSIEVAVERGNKKYDFHYQFKDGKLFLYGPFEQNLYEIMEFFNDHKRTVFLFYNNKYYLLEDGNTKVNSLNPINDQALLKKLREYRENKK